MAGDPVKPKSKKPDLQQLVTTGIDSMNPRQGLLFYTDKLLNAQNTPRAFNRNQDAETFFLSIEQRLEAYDYFSKVDQENPGLLDQLLNEIKTKEEDKQTPAESFYQSRLASYRAHSASPIAQEAYKFYSEIYSQHPNNAAEAYRLIEPIHITIRDYVADETIRNHYKDYKKQERRKKKLENRLKKATDATKRQAIQAKIQALNPNQPINTIFGMFSIAVNNQPIIPYATLFKLIEINETFKKLCEAENRQDFWFRLASQFYQHCFFKGRDIALTRRENVNYFQMAGALFYLGLYHQLNDQLNKFDKNAFPLLRKRAEDYLKRAGQAGFSLTEPPLPANQKLRTNAALDNADLSQLITAYPHSEEQPNPHFMLHGAIALLDETLNQISYLSQLVLLAGQTHDQSKLNPIKSNIEITLAIITNRYDAAKTADQANNPVQNGKPTRISQSIVAFFGINTWKDADLRINKAIQAGNAALTQSHI